MSNIVRGYMCDLVYICKLDGSLRILDFFILWSYVIVFRFFNFLVIIYISLVIWL